MQTVIKKILSDRKRFLTLLLLADEQETIIDKYIWKTRSNRPSKDGSN